MDTNTKMSSRREFFGSLMGFRNREEKKEAFAPFPPFFNPSMSESCYECETFGCVTSCGEDVIKISSDRVPRLNFSLRGCTFCADCASSCKFKVFTPLNDSKINATFEIDIQSCLAWQNTICKSCFDPCLDKAIEFSGFFYPQINAEKCTACGFCIKVCPTSAIRVKEVQDVKEV